MPLICHGRLLRSKIVKAFQHFLACAIWTAIQPRCFRRNLRLIGVPQGAFPPYCAVAACGYLCRFQRPVFFGVPFVGYLGIFRGKIVFPGYNYFVAAYRTSQACAARRYFGSPLMAFCTAPPDLSDASTQHLLRGQVGVLFRVPLLCNSWIFCRQIIETGFYLFAGTNGTRALPQCSCSYLRAPFMAMFTNPPHTAMCTRRYL